MDDACLCLDCTAFLYNFHDFKQRCMRTEVQLRSYTNEHPEAEIVDLEVVFPKCIPTEVNGMPIKTVDLPPKPKLTAKCDLCDRWYLSEKTLRYHKSRFHAKQRYKCTDCGRDFCFKTQFDKHIEYHKQPNSNRFTCSVCGFVYHAKSALIKHSFKHMDEKEKPFGCDVCKMRFVEKNSLTVHMRRHTGEKPYRCRLCNYATRSVSAFYKHASVKHNIEVARKVNKGDFVNPFAARKGVVLSTGQEVEVLEDTLQIV